MIAAGFGEQVNRVEHKQCPFCCNAVTVHPHAKFYRKTNPPNPVEADLFRDDLIYREFKISGLCQECQDKTFGK